MCVCVGGGGGGDGKKGGGSGGWEGWGTNQKCKGVMRKIQKSSMRQLK